MQKNLRENSTTKTIFSIHDCCIYARTFDRNRKTKIKTCETTKKKIYQTHFHSNSQKKNKAIQSRHEQSLKIIQIKQKSRQFIQNLHVHIDRQREKKIIDKIVKISFLISFFFSKSFITNLSNIKNFEYSTKIEFNELIDHEIQNVITNMSSNKFFENDEIINKILKFILDIIFLFSILRKLFQTSLNNQYCSKYFKKSITIFLKKLDKNTYNIFKIYKSITLFNIIDKIFESIMTNKLA